MNFIKTSTIVLTSLVLPLSVNAQDNPEISNTTQLVKDIIDALPEDALGFVTDTKTDDYRAIRSSDVTDGVIEDYIEVLEFIEDRQRTSINPSRFSPLQETYPNVIYHQKADGAYAGDEIVGLKPLDYCPRECRRLLLEGHVDQVTVISYHPETLDVLEDGVRNFKRADTCDPGDNGLPALGLCLTSKLGETPDAALHIYSNMTSPLWPRAFEYDMKHSYNPGPTLQASYSTGRVLPDLKHINVRLGQNPMHRAASISRKSDMGETSILREDICLRVTPRLPAAAVRLIQNKWVNEDQAEYTDNMDGLCYGDEDAKYDGFFGDEYNNGHINITSIMTADEIESALKASAKQSPASVAKDIAWLQDNHPNFDTDIADRIAPILVQSAAYESRTNFVTLSKMPHQSMEPYLGSLKIIFERYSKAHNCTGFLCKEDDQFWHHQVKTIPMIFNATGESGADYLNDVFKQGFSVEITRDGPRWERIAGVIEASVCAGKIGDDIAKPISIDGSPNSKKLMHLSWLRLSNRKDEAKQTLEWYVKTYTDKIAGGSTRERNIRDWEAMLTSAKGLQNDWDDLAPVCPSRS